MQSIHRYVVFDTNVYSDLCRRGETSNLATTLRDLLAREGAAGIEARASPAVMAELVKSWVNRPSGSENPRRRIKALVQHCSSPSGNLRMVADRRTIDYAIAFGETSMALVTAWRRLARRSHRGMLSRLLSGNSWRAFASPWRIGPSDLLNQCALAKREDLLNRTQRLH